LEFAPPKVSGLIPSAAFSVGKVHTELALALNGAPTSGR